MRNGWSHNVLILMLLLVAENGYYSIREHGFLSAPSVGTIWKTGSVLARTRDGVMKEIMSSLSSANRDQMTIVFEPRQVEIDHILSDGDSRYIHLHLKRSGSEEFILENGLIFRIVFVDEERVRLDRPMAEMKNAMAEYFVELHGLIPDEMLRWLLTQAEDTVLKHAHMLLRDEMVANWFLLGATMPMEERGIWMIRAATESLEGLTIDKQEIQSKAGRIAWRRIAELQSAM